MEYTTIIKYSYHMSTFDRIYYCYYYGRSNLICYYNQEYESLHYSLFKHTKVTWLFKFKSKYQYQVGELQVHLVTIMFIQNIY